MLDSQVDYAAEYGGALADHLPMAIYGLYAMGADRIRRDTFAARYIRSKALRPLGIDDSELRAREALYERMSAQGWEPVFRAEAASLAYGLGAGAFHAFIRAAYGILANDSREISAALVYWRAAALPVGSAWSLPIDAEPFDPEAALGRVRGFLGNVPERLSNGDLIAGRMRSVSLEPMFDLACGRPRVSGAFIASIARTTVRAFAAGRSFTLLHAMTATHALRIIEPYVDDRVSLYQFFWRAYVAAWVSSGALPLRDLADFASDIEAAPSWDELLPLACASDDEHVVKVAFTAWDEDKTYGDPLYRVAVARYLKVI